MNTYIDIDGLKVTSRDAWLKKRIKKVGSSIYTHPNYLFLKGDIKLFARWMKEVDRDVEHRRTELWGLLESIKAKGQINPIVINKKQELLNGHKRTSIMAFLGYKSIKVKTL